MISFPEAPVSEYTDNNLFLAILPEGEASYEVDRIADQSRAAYQLTGQPLGRPRYHVSIHSLGHFPEVPDELVTVLDGIFAPLAASTEPLGVQMDRALSFEVGRPKRPLVLSSSKVNWPLLDLFRRIGRRIGVNRKSLTPHVTMLYDAKSIEEHPVTPISWMARELVLVRSYVGLGRHEHLARWSFRGGRYGWN